MRVLSSGVLDGETDSLMFLMESQAAHTYRGCVFSGAQVILGHQTGTRNPEGLSDYPLQITCDYFQAVS